MLFQPVTHSLSAYRSELHPETVLRPGSTLSSKAFNFLWQRMPWPAVPNCWPGQPSWWLTPQDSPEGRTARLCMCAVTTAIFHHPGLHLHSAARPPPLPRCLARGFVFILQPVPADALQFLASQDLCVSQDLRNPWQEAGEG